MVFKRSITEWLLLFYFCVILAHSSIPYLKFVLWAANIALAFLDFLYKPEHQKVKVTNVMTVLMWYGVLFGIVSLSQLWSIVEELDSKLIPSMLRWLCVLLFVAVYVVSEERLWRFVDILITATTYFSLVFVLTSPPSTWGTPYMGGVTGQMRTFSGNASAIILIMCIAAWKSGGLMFDEKCRKFFTIKYGICAALNLLAIFISGSRGGLFSFGIMFICLMLFNPSASKRAALALAGLLAAVIGVYLLFEVPLLYDLFGQRILNMFAGKDESVNDRLYFWEVAWEMFCKKPIIGWGYDGFSQYLYEQKHYKIATYSHSNYLEILSGYGLVGFITYYWTYVRLWIREWKDRRTNSISLLICVLLVRYLIFELTTVTYEVLLYIMAIGTMIFASNIRRLQKDDEQRDALILKKRQKDG